MNDNIIRQVVEIFNVCEGDMGPTALTNSSRCVDRFVSPGCEIDTSSRIKKDRIIPQKPDPVDT